MAEDTAKAVNAETAQQAATAGNQPPGTYHVETPEDVPDSVFFVLTPNEFIYDADLEKDVETIQKRLDALGERYYIELHEREIRITANRRIFGDNELEVDCTKYLVTSTEGLRLSVPSGGSVTLTSNDINGIEICEQAAEDALENEPIFYLRLQVPPSTMKKVSPFISLLQKYKNGDATIGAVLFNEYPMQAISAINSATIEFGGITHQQAMLVKEVLSGDSLIGTYAINHSRFALAAPYEVKALEGPTVSFSLVPENSNMDEQPVITDEAFEIATSIVRSRLGRLQQPFSIAIRNRVITITTNPERMGYPIIRLLEKKASLEIYPQFGPRLLDPRIFATQQRAAIS